ncbi:MAG: amidinotransferase [Oligoflexus sp.]|nr:amidinotransferase [Oligoflexus sp.]
MSRTHTSRKIARSAQTFPVQKQGLLVYMIDPEAYDIVQAINPHMRNEDGNLNTVDREKAKVQWQHLKDVYESIGFSVEVLKAKKDCEDMVFCANQTFPFLDILNKPSVIISNMANDKRQLETESVQEQLMGLGINCQALPLRNPDTLFEGMGDALWVPGRRLICGGYGSRTRKEIYESVKKLSGSSAFLFELSNPRLYHLDTCLSILSDKAVLACREGFTEEGWDLLQDIFECVIAVPLTEADAPGFACNAHSPDARHVIIQRGNAVTCALLQSAGFMPIEIETDEFIKSGGSVFCMKLQTLWDA